MTLFDSAHALAEAVLKAHPEIVDGKTLDQLAADVLRFTTPGTPRTDRIPDTFAIRNVISCRKCVEELNPPNQIIEGHPTARLFEAFEHFRLVVGRTDHGVQIWCNRHGMNVAHIDFRGMKLQAALTGAPGETTVVPYDSPFPKTAFDRVLYALSVDERSMIVDALIKLHDDLEKIPAGDRAHDVEQVKRLVDCI